jgi:predicted RNase H-like nuclease (RuvC/YqgF family)
MSYSEQEAYKWAMKEIERLEVKIKELEAKIEEQDGMIKQLRKHLTSTAL